MLKFNFRFEHFVIVVLVIILLLENCKGNDQPCDTESTTVKVSEEIVTEKDSVFNNNIKNREPEKVQIIETPEKVSIISDSSTLDPKDKNQVKEVNRYIDTTRITDGYVISDILSEGRILKLDLKTSIDHLKRTIETTKKTTRNAGGLYFSPTVEYIPVLGFSSAGIGFNYIKGDLGFGLGGFYDFRNNHIGFRFTIHKKLF